jgi:hypothetical protein
MAGLFIPSGAAGQSGGLLLDAGFSYSLPPASVTAESTPYLFLGTRLGVPLGDRANWNLSGATGLSLESTGSSWVSVMTGLDAALHLGGSLFFDLSLQGEAFSVGDPYPYRAAVGEAEPAIRLELGSATLRLVGSGGIGRSEVRAWDGVPAGPGDGGGFSQSGPDIVSDLWSWGGRLEAYFRRGAAEPRFRLEAYTAPQGDYFGGGAGVRFAAFGSDWVADVGVWETPGGAELQFGVNVYLPLRHDLALRVNGGRYRPDPLLDTPPAGSAGAIASWTVTRFGEPSSSLYRIESGSPARVHFRLQADETSVVELVGDFTEWQPIPMLRVQDAWVLALAVEPGLHRFGFLVDGDWYLPDEADGRVTDDWGLEQTTLVVPEP